MNSQSQLLWSMQKNAEQKLAHTWYAHFLMFIAKFMYMLNNVLYWEILEVFIITQYMWCRKCFVVSTDTKLSRNVFCFCFPLFRRIASIIAGKKVCLINCNHVCLGEFLSVVAHFIF